MVSKSRRNTRCSRNHCFCIIITGICKVPKTKQSIDWSDESFISVDVKATNLSTAEVIRVEISHDLINRWLNTGSIVTSTATTCFAND